MKINVKHVAKLANLPLTDAEEKKFENQLSDILTYIEQLNSVDTKGAEITSQITGLENVTREDKSTSSFSQDEALSNSKSSHNGMFKAKKVL